MTDSSSQSLSVDTLDALKDAHYETRLDTSNLRDLKLLKQLWPFIKPHFNKILVSFLLLPLVAITQMLQPYIVRWTIDGPITDGSVRQLIFYCAGFLVILLIHYVVRYFQMLVSQEAGQLIVRDIRTKLYAHLQGQDLEFFHKNPVGKLVTRVTSDVENLSEMLSSGGLAILQDVALIIGGVAGMFIMEWHLALIATGMLMVNLYLMEFFRRKARIAYNEIRIKLAMINTFIQENVTGIELVQLYRREKKNIHDFETLSDTYYTSRVDSIMYTLSFNSLVELLTLFTNAIILYVAGHAILQGDMTYGLLAAFFLFINLAFEPVENISEKMTTLQSGLASIDKVMGLFSQKAGIQKDERDAQPLKDVEGRIDFRNVSFGYVTDALVLKNLNLDIASGEKIAVVGHTGSGKTTLIKLLMRFYDVNEGAILLDGTDIREINPKALRNQMVSIQQDDMIFSRSLVENITLKNQRLKDLNDAELKRINHAIDEVHAREIINRLPDGLDSVLEEQGKNLSVGERQLILFARAIYHDPAILILDEATSAIDSHTEQLIQQAMDDMMAGRTSIVIAHRLSTIEKADRILVIDEGTIAESGTHQELLAQNGRYAKFYQYQSMLDEE